MGILKLAFALLVTSATGCYDPQLRDCTLTCNTQSDCAGDQVCGSDHFCAAPDIAGTCSSLPGDAGSKHRDAGVDTPKMADARPDAAPDAATHAELTVSIEAKGRVTMIGIGTCDEAPPQNGQCTFTVLLGSLVTASAQGYPDWRFDRWTTSACASTPIATCTFVFNAATPLGVKFKRDD
jgi:hypothetical protein